MAALQEKIKDKSIKIAVIGLGWMGLPTACLFAETGFKVTGVDIDLKVVKVINDAKSPIPEPTVDAMIRRNVESGRLKATSNIKQAATDNEAIIIIVPTAIDENRKPDYSAVEKACREIGKGLQGHPSAHADTSSQTKRIAWAGEPAQAPAAGDTGAPPKAEHPCLHHGHLRRGCPSA